MTLATQEPPPDFACETLDEFLEQWGDELGKEADRAMAPLHVPSRDGVSHLIPMGVTPYPGQAHAIVACCKVLHRQNTVNLVAEQGSGKGPMAVIMAHNFACQPPDKRWHKKNPGAAGFIQSVYDELPNYRAMVMCPGHMPHKWEDEIKRALPHAKVKIIKNFTDVIFLDPKAKPSGPEWYIVAKDRAKLSCGWKGAYIKVRHMGLKQKSWPACPRCQTPIVNPKDGGPQPDAYFEAARRRCPATVERNGRKVVCDEQLWQDIRKPDRYAPALFIKKKLGRYFDFYIMDEVQDGRSKDSIQADAMGFLSSAAKKTITLTGTLVGGKATDVRTLLFRTGNARRLVDMGFGWNDETAYVERYGRIETKIITKGESDGEGHRLARGGRKKGRTATKTIKPGIMPTLFGEHLVSTCIFLSLDEVCADMPKFSEDCVPVDLLPDHLAEYQRIEAALRTAIKQLMFTKNGPRQILSKMLQALLAYPDFPLDWEEIGYHLPDPRQANLPKDEQELIWVPIVKPVSLEKDIIYPKEEALLNQILREKRDGRKSWVFTTLVEKRDSIGRLEGILNKHGLKATVLRSGSVAPIDRDRWIKTNGPRYDVILSHPELVKTGLDFFDKNGRFNFPTIMFFMTGYDCFTLSQASRRAWRIMQKRECRVLYFFYAGTMQETAMTLMGRKMAACQAVSGRFSMEGLSAMAGEDDGMEMAMAKALVDKTSTDGEALRAWARITTPITYQTFDESIDKIDILDLLDDLPLFNEVPE